MPPRKKQEPVKVRTLRHWKQQFEPGAKFIWRRKSKWAGVTYESGTPLDPEIIPNKAKLRRLWEAGRIELAQFTAPKNVTSGRDKARSPSYEEPLKNAKEYALYRRGIAVGMSDSEAKAHAKGKPPAKAKKPAAAKAKAPASKKTGQNKAPASKTDSKAKEKTTAVPVAGKTVTTGGGIRPPTPEEVDQLRAAAEANLADI